MSPSAAYPAGLGRGPPRASGDEPCHCPSEMKEWQVRPARAGMSPSGQAAQPARAGPPRASGDEPKVWELVKDGWTSAPRERG